MVGLSGISIFVFFFCFFQFVEPAKVILHPFFRVITVAFLLYFIQISQPLIRFAGIFAILINRTDDVEAFPAFCLIIFQSHNADVPSLLFSSLFRQISSRISLFIEPCTESCAHIQRMMSMSVRKFNFI